MTVPPNGGNVTYVDFDLDFQSVKQIDENKMHLSLNIYEYQSWDDKRLDYSKNPNISQYLKSSRLDFS